MRRLLLIALCVTGVWLPVSAQAAAPLPEPPLTQGAVTPADAVRAGLAQDGAEMLVQGEAIGEALMAPGGKRWVNILGGGTAIGVVVEAEDARAIERFGEYGQRGSTLLVRGVVNSACDEHGGDLDMHATSVRVLDGGHATPHVVDPRRFVLAGSAAVSALILLLQYRRLRRRSYL